MILFDKKKQNYIHNNLILESIIGKKNSFNFNGLSVDSRTIKKNNLFLAIRGKRYNGNEYIFRAIKKGAGC